jgi:hypothetical protein
MQHNDLHVLQIYSKIDNFCKEISFLFVRGKNLSDNKKHRQKPSRLSLSEIMTIMVLFHLSNYRDFKHFYLFQICQVMRPAFPGVVSYNRMVELMRQALIPMVLFLKLECKGKATGISFLDSTHLAVCHNKRIHQNKVFKGLAERGKTTIGWFYGFKLHLIINEKGELLSFGITKGNVDDRNIDLLKDMTKDIFGKIYADKGYISQTLFELLFEDGKELITKLKKNMKGKVMTFVDRLLLRKRAIIESVNDELKNICQIDHTRHRSPVNWLMNLFSGLTAYMFLPKKPSLKIECKFDSNLLLI